MVGAPHGGAKTIGGKDAFEIVFDFWGRVESAHQAAADAGGPAEGPRGGDSLPIVVSASSLAWCLAAAAFAYGARPLKAQKIGVGVAGIVALIMICGFLATDHTYV